MALVVRVAPVMNSGANNAPPTAQQLAHGVNMALMALTPTSGVAATNWSTVLGALEFLVANRKVLLRHSDVKCNFFALVDFLVRLLEENYQTAVRYGVARMVVDASIYAVQLLIYIHNEGPDGKVPAEDRETDMSIKHLKFFETKVSPGASKTIDIKLRRKIRALVCEYWLYLAACVEADPVSVLKYLKGSSFAVAQSAPDCFRFYVASLSQATQQLLYKEDMPHFDNLPEFFVDLILDLLCRVKPTLTIDGANDIAVAWLVGFCLTISSLLRMLVFEFTSSTQVPMFAVARGWTTLDASSSLRTQKIIATVLDKKLSVLVREKKLTPYHLELMAIRPTFLPLVKDAVLLLCNTEEQEHYMRDWAFSAPKVSNRERTQEILALVAVTCLGVAAVEDAIVQEGMPLPSLLKCFHLWRRYLINGHTFQPLMTGQRDPRRVLPVIPVPPALAGIVGLALFNLLKALEVKGEPGREGPRPPLVLEGIKALQHCAAENYDAFLSYLNFPSRHRRSSVIEAFFFTMGTMLTVINIAMTKDKGWEPRTEHGVVALSALSRTFPLFRTIAMKTFSNQKAHATAASFVLSTASAASTRAFEVVSEDRKTLEEVLQVALELASQDAVHTQDIMAHRLFPYLCGMGSPIAAKHLNHVDPALPPSPSNSAITATATPEGQQGGESTSRSTNNTATTEASSKQCNERSVSLLATYWIPTALKALTMKGVVPPKAHDAIIAPIREGNSWTLPLVSTYITAFAPDPEDEKPRYGKPSATVLRRYASAVRSVCQSAESFSSTVPVATGLDEEEHSDVSPGVGAALLVVQRTFECLKYQVNTRNAPTSEEARMYAAALINLLQCSDPRIVHRVCEDVEMFLAFHNIRGNGKISHFWRQYLTDTIQRSTTSSTKASLAEWLLTLDERIAKHELKRRVLLPSKL